MEGERPDCDISRRKVLQSTAGITAMGFAGNASATRTPPDDREKVGSSRFIQIGVTHDGLPDVQYIFYDHLKDHIVEHGEDSSITLLDGDLAVAARKPPVDNAGNVVNNRSLKEILLGPKPVIKTPRGFYASRSINYQRTKANIPEKLTSGYLTQRAVHAQSTYEGPELRITVQNETVRVQSEGDSISVNAGESTEMALEERTVDILVMSEETKEIQDPRLNESSNSNHKTRTVAKTSVEKHDITPKIKIDNLGYSDVLEPADDE